MKEIIRRILIVLWLPVLVGAFVRILETALSTIAWIGGNEFDPEPLQIAAIYILPVWSLQFIATGIVNPVRLLREAATKKVC